MHFSIVHAWRYAVAPVLSILAVLFTPAFAQRPPDQPDAAQILHRMQKLDVVGSALYIAAHPDDENTRLISWLANGKKVRTGYLSLTRGDGGQNLIGPELSDPLGIIRTQELMEARRIDGGDQFFTRAVDFGYSKSAEESFAKWGKKEVLGDVVRVIRMFRPDVIITRFPTDGGGGHGHHTASAILAAEAFDLAGDPKAYPEQLKEGLTVWKPRRLFFNGSTWWRRDLADFAKTDPDWFTVDVGGYDPLLGLSYTEIAGRSRSMHKSQGFGAAETRGEMIEYLHFEKGDRPAANDIFAGIDITWERVKKGLAIRAELGKVISAYRVDAPHASTASLVGLLRTLKSYDASDWQIAWAMRRVSDLIRMSAGLSIEYLFANSMTHATDGMAELVVVNRSPFPIAIGPWDDFEVAANASANRLTAPLNGGPQPGPFWLDKPHGTLYDVASNEIGIPVFRKNAIVPVTILGERIDVEVAPMHKWVDRVAGERVQPAFKTPVASLKPSTNIVIARGGTQEIQLEVETLTDDLIGQVYAALPEGWATTKDIKVVNLSKQGDKRSFTFKLIPSEKAKSGKVKFEFTGTKGSSERTMHVVDYPHIMPQLYFTPAEVDLVKLDVKVNAQRVGYIKGAGDDVPQAIERLGVQVDMLDPSSATLESLSKYDAIVVGIRAYNTEKAMARFNPILMRYVEDGGTVVAQYNTRSSDMMVPDSLIGPYPFKLTRDRVTVEEAPATFLKRDHPLMKSPNVITATDFDGWVQERGLYFCGEIDEHYSQLIAWNDPGEEPLKGALITCEYGKGRYVYTGISFFRQLPAGVPGAYRLWANLISRGDRRE